jgi:hypothetical protein
MTSAVPRGRRPLACAAACIAIATAALASAPARAQASAPAVKGVTRLRASKISSLKLTVPRDVKLSLNYWDEDRLTGPTFSPGDDLAAVVIQGEGDTFSIVRLPKGEGQIQRVVSLAPENCQLDPTCSLQAGEYQVYVVTESPVVVTLRFEGLPGKTALTSTGAITGKISGATQSYSIGTGTAPPRMDAHGAGFAPELPGRRNYVFSAFWFHGPSDPAGPPPADQPLVNSGVAGGCIYFGQSPPADAYAPGCPAGDMSGAHSTTRALADCAFQQWNEMVNIGPGVIGMGNYAVHTGVHDPGFVGFWLDLTSAT